MADAVTLIDEGAAHSASLLTPTHGPTHPSETEPLQSQLEGCPEKLKSNRQSILEDPPYVTPVIRGHAQLMFMDGIRLIMQFLTCQDFKSTRVFRICRHWWHATTSINTIGFTFNHPPVNQYEVTLSRYPSTILASSAFGSAVELCWNGDLKQIESMLNQLTSHCSGIEVLRVNTYEHSDVPQLIRQLLKFRHLKTLTVGHSLQPLLDAPIGLPDTLRRIEWCSNRPLSDGCIAFRSTPLNSLDAFSRVKVGIATLPLLQEFRHYGPVRWEWDGQLQRQEDLGAINRDLLLQYIHHLPNLTNFEVNAMTENCIPILSQFKHLRQLSFGLCDARGSHLRMSSNLLYNHRRVFSSLLRMELKLGDTYLEDDHDPPQWQSFFSSLTNLNHLILSDAVKESLFIIFPGIHVAPRLITLTINPRVHDSDIATWKLLSQLDRCQSLTELNIWPNHTDRPLHLIFDHPIHYRHELLGRSLWPNLQRFYLGYTRYIFPPLRSTRHQTTAAPKSMTVVN